MRDCLCLGLRGSKRASRLFVDPQRASRLSLHRESLASLSTESLSPLSPQRASRLSLHRQPLASLSTDSLPPRCGPWMTTRTRVRMVRLWTLVDVAQGYGREGVGWGGGAGGYQITIRMSRSSTGSSLIWGPAAGERSESACGRWSGTGERAPTACGDGGLFPGDIDGCGQRPRHASRRLRRSLHRSRHGSAYTPSAAYPSLRTRTPSIFISSI